MTRSTLNPPPHYHSNKSVLDASDASFTAAKDSKLSSIDDSANNYTHPVTHLPAIILQDVSNRFTTDIEKATWNAKQAALGFTPEDSAKKGQANGYSELDASGRIPTAQLPTSAMEYKGSYNIVTNTPILIDGTGLNGDYYKASIAGSRDFGSGLISVVSGDAIIYNGLIWEKIPGDDIVQSVAGKIGVVTLDTDDVSEASNLYHTEARVEAHVFDSLKLTGAPSDLMTWNDTDKTIDVKTGLGPVRQEGQETHIIVYNLTGSDIPNGRVVSANGNHLGKPSVVQVLADTHETITNPIWVSTMLIPDGQIGIVTKFGYVRGINTTGLIDGKPIYASAETGHDGEITSIRPAFPNYDISIGGVTTIDAVNGEIFVDVSGKPIDTIQNFWNGIFRETFSFVVASNGTTVTGSLSPENSHPDLTMKFSDGISLFTATPPATIVIPPGTDDIPQQTFVYIPQSTKVLTISTSDWPTSEHIKIATVVLRTALTTQNDGALKVHAWTDPIQGTTTNQGHLSHMTTRMRQMPASWDSGVEGSVVIDTGDVFVKSTSGKVYQMHLHEFPALDMQTVDDIHVANHSSSPYLTTTNLNTQVLNALGATMANTSFSFVVWGIQNKTGQKSHLMLNLPTGSYAKNSPDLAVSDALNYSVYNIPKMFRGVGFLIARFTFVLEADGITWSLYDTEDLRGKIPNTTAGGGGGGTGVTTLLALTDTPASYIGNKGKMLRVNEAETGSEFAVLKTGTLAIPPTGLFIGEHWLDITDSSDHPEIRVSQVAT